MAHDEKLNTFRNRMSHWRMDGAVYFLTWRLQPSQSKLAKTERTIVATAIKHFRGKRYELYAYVVMDDHVHVLAKPTKNNSLSSILHSWKSFTATQINRTRQKKGSLWQKDTYERIVRDSDELYAHAEYILNNPLKSWPDTSEYEWAEWFADAWK